MITLTAKMQAAEGKEQELEAVLRELVKGTATEEGSVEYRLHRVLDTPGAFRFVEKFKDQEAFDFHANSDHFKAAIEKIGKLTAGDGELEMLELIDSIPE
ncbi:putative quinol monooxygenase [Maridesulfovibrio sp.]|uniref:putative quinol monooxygenase n=1 Tax=Maridesulfovibrio sp. TaxID=2795000 RepID=UPI002A18D612|nr:putative quinol monooxygenase [Maridesulfovibrio sp.]